MANTPAFADRRVADLAAEMMALFGDDAVGQAATRADASRDVGNLSNFCRWRDVERLIAHLSGDEAGQMLH